MVTPDTDWFPDPENRSENRSIVYVEDVQLMKNGNKNKSVAFIFLFSVVLCIWLLAGTRNFVFLSLLLTVTGPNIKLIPVISGYSKDTLRS